MAKIKVNKDMLRKNSQDLQKMIQELEQLNNNLNNLLIRIQESWEGDSCNAYISMMRNYATKAEKMVTVLTEFRSYIDTAVTKFENTDKQSASRLRRAF